MAPTKESNKNNDTPLRTNRHAWGRGGEGGLCVVEGVSGRGLCVIWGVSVSMRGGVSMRGYGCIIVCVVLSREEVVWCGCVVVWVWCGVGVWWCVV